MGIVRHKENAMPRKVKLFAAGLLLAVVGIACVAMAGKSAHAESDYEPYIGDGWSITANGVMTIESNQGWWNAMKHGFKPNVQTLVISRDLTAFRVYNLPYDVPGPNFFGPEDVSGYDKNGKPYYDDYLRSTDIYPERIEVDPDNPVFFVIDGMLINSVTNELVLCDMHVTDVVIPEGVKTITRAAFSERDIQTVGFPSSLEVIGEDAFAKCEDLTKIELPDSITELRSGAFLGCEKLKEVKLSLKLQVLGGYAFCECPITSIEVPKMVEEIGAFAFLDCDQLLQVSLPEGLRKIKTGTFSGCKQLRKINFPDQLDSIGEQAFCDCDSLKQVILPDSLQQVGNRAFWDCKLSVLRIPQKLMFPVYDFKKREFIVNSHTKKDKTFDLSSVETVIFSGSDYDFGYPAISHAHNVYFLGKPPEDVGQILDENSVESIFCSDEFEFEWTRSTVASWVRQRLTILPAEELKDIADQEINATPLPTDVPRPTPRPTETPWPTPMPRPTASPAKAAKPQQQGTDPLVFAFAGILALVIAGIVVVAVKSRRPKKRAQKRK